jgi:hypothetical protein
MEWSEPYVKVSVTSKMLRQQIKIDEAINKILVDTLMHPPTPEQIAERRAARQAEWDEKTAQGLVPIADYSDDGPAVWEQVDKHELVDKWVSEEAWARYSTAVRLLREAEEAF